jgi:hypothetical protein
MDLCIPHKVELEMEINNLRFYLDTTKLSDGDILKIIKRIDLLEKCVEYVEFKEKENGV